MSRHVLSLEFKAFQPKISLACVCLSVLSVSSWARWCWQNFLCWGRETIPWSSYFPEWADTFY